jgi:hypothetical protein
MISAVVTLAGIAGVTGAETVTGVETTATVEQMVATHAGLVGVTRGSGTGVEVAMTTVADLTWQWQSNTRNNPTL